jgi:hypothetical protein
MLSLQLFLIVNVKYMVDGFTSITPSILCRTNAIRHHVIHRRQQEHYQTLVFSGLTEHHENDDSTVVTNNNNDEAQRLLDRVKQMRMEIAALTGQTIEDVEREAAIKKSRQMEQESKKRINIQQKPLQQRQYVLPVPETVAEQVQQAANAIERAYNDGNILKQIVRFAFVPIVTSNDLRNSNDRDRDQQSVMFVRNDQDWPGGIQQIYREAARPYTYQLLEQLRIKNDSHTIPSSVSSSNTFGKQKPLIQEQTLWDFDGSAIITAATNDKDEETSTATTLIQALIHPNTDNRYFNDIIQMDERLSERTKISTQENKDIEEMTQERNGVVNLIINPFWTNATSWGYNIFAPHAQQRANDIIFSSPSDKNDGSGGYIETYCVITKTVRGEDCIAIKAYPYDWQLYAYLEEVNDRRYYSTTSTVHLGSTVMEPSITDFVQLLNNRTEFQYSKNMRQMQRTLNK